MNYFFTYILKCSDGSYYVGHTDNLDQRIADHQAGKVDGYTSARLPVALIFSQDFPTRDEAFIAERQIKGWSRKKKEALIRGDWNSLTNLAVRYSKTFKSSNPSTRTSCGSGRAGEAV